MNRITGVLFHELKGIPGWSSLDISKIDIGRVSSIGYRKRLFALSDKDHPYTMEIEYYLPKSNMNMAPVATMSGIGGTVYNETVLEQCITKRYPNEKSVQDEIKEIQDKMTKLDKYSQKLEKFIINS
jgi:hypothetical protein